MHEFNVRKKGDSLVIVFSKNFIEEKHLKEDDVLIISDIIKKSDLRPVYRSLKRKMSGQKFKDMAREGWK